MSLVTKVGHAGQLKSEIRLAQVVSHFEASLSDEQKVGFRALRTQTLKSPPGINDVLRLTTEIDPLQKVGHRCFGPRFTNFLHGVQRFAALGDVIIGGSQNLIACGVWSIVRMSLLSIVNFSSYVEHLSQLFMEVGQLAPLHEKIALLYPKSERLQSQLNEYFIVVVSLCHHVMTFSRKSAISRFSAAFSDPDLKNFRSELGSWSNSIKSEVNVLMAERIEIEAQSTSRFRTALSKQKSRQARISLWHRVLDLCTDYDHETTWKQIRKVGNTVCFQTNEYTTWKEGQNCRNCQNLVYHGKLGCGKSVMLANIVQDLHSQTTSTVAYFFCKQDLPESLKARTIFGSLVRQLLYPFQEQARDKESSNIPSNFERKTSMDYEDLFLIVGNFLSSSHQTNLVLDGLDLLNRAEYDEILDNLQILTERFVVRVCMSLRMAPNEKLSIVNQKLLSPMFTLMPDNQQDIDNFVELELKCRLQHGTLTIGDPTLILEIRDALSTLSEGMFLWVILQIESLCDMQSDKEIRGALKALPRDLSKIYSRILKKRQVPMQQYQTLIFELVIAAMRPLTVDEMRDALSVTPGDRDWTAAKVLNDVYKTLGCCGCLLTIDEEEQTLRLVHPSARSFLLDEYRDMNGLRIHNDGAQAAMADILVTYLSYSIFQTDLSKARIKPIDVGPMPKRIVNASATGTNINIASKLAIKFLERRKVPNFDVSKILAEAGYSDKEDRMHHLYSYAVSYCLRHIPEPGLGPQTNHLLPTLIRRGMIDQARKLVDPAVGLFHFAVRTRSTGLLNTLLFLGETQGINSKEESRGLTPLELAIKTTYFEGFCLLLQSKYVVVNFLSGVYRTPLMVSIKLGKEEFVKRLIDSADTNLNELVKSDVSLEYVSPLIYAISLGFTGIAIMLIESGRIDVNLTIKPRVLSKYRSALAVAIKMRNTEILTEILSKLRDTGQIKLPHEEERLDLKALAREKGYDDVIMWVEDIIQCLPPPVVEKE